MDIEYSGKNIAIIGPSQDILEKNEGEYIDSHDLVIRIKVPNDLYPFDDELAEKIGRKMDLNIMPGCFPEEELFKTLQLLKRKNNGLFTMPTLAFNILYRILSSGDFAKLTIRGITFYQGGKNIFKEIKGIKGSDKPTDHHYPEIEFSVFKELISDKLDRIDLSDKLKELVNLDSS